jgi:apolipoprotein D and lipocalin family protein
MPRHLLTLLLLLGLTACGTAYRNTDVPMVAQADFEPEDYLGTWYEIARYPVPFQRGCTATQATYAPLAPGRISVLNTCRDGSPDGPLKQIEGTADIVGPGQLKVQFPSVPFVRSDYWVLWVDETYQTALVGVPNGRAGWILARTPEISPEARAQAEAVLRANGNDPTQLIEVAHAR